MWAHSSFSFFAVQKHASASIAYLVHGSNLYPDGGMKLLVLQRVGKTKLCRCHSERRVEGPNGSLRTSRTLTAEAPSVCMRQRPGAGGLGKETWRASYTKAKQRKLNGWPQNMRNAKLNISSVALRASPLPEPNPHPLAESTPHAKWSRPITAWSRTQSPDHLRLPVMPSILDSLPPPVDTSLISTAGSDTESPGSKMADASISAH